MGENAERGKGAKMRPLNAKSERKLQKCDRKREWGASAAWEDAESGKAAKMRQSNSVIEQMLPKIRPSNACERGASAPWDYVV